MIHSVSEPLQSCVVFPNPSHHSFCVEPGNYTTFTPKDQGCAVQDCCEWLPSAPLKPSHASRDRDPAPATFPEQPTLVGQLFARFTTTLSRPHFDHTHTQLCDRRVSASTTYVVSHRRSLICTCVRVCGRSCAYPLAKPLFCQQYQY